MTTTNGTRALRACAPASAVLLGSFLNLRATAEFIEHQDPAHLLLVCSGTLDQAAYEDVLGAGALCDLLWARYGGGAVADSAHIARRLFRLEQNDLLGALAQSRNARRLMAHPELRDDVPFCSRARPVRPGRGTGQRWRNQNSAPSRPQGPAQIIHALSLLAGGSLRKAPLGADVYSQTTPGRTKLRQEWACRPTPSHYQTMLL